MELDILHQHVSQRHQTLRAQPVRARPIFRHAAAARRRRRVLLPRDAQRELALRRERHLDLARARLELGRSTAAAALLALPQLPAQQLAQIDRRRAQLVALVCDLAAQRGGSSGGAQGEIVRRSYTLPCHAAGH